MDTSTDAPSGTTGSPPTGPSPQQLQRQQLIAQALKDKVPLASLDPTSGTYDDLDSAAQAFYGAIGAHDPKLEESGVIFSDTDGKFHYSIPSAQHDDAFKMRVPQSATQKLAALFHSHPAGEGQESLLFSPDDVQVANQLKVPSYIYFERDGTMKKYIPGVTKTTMHSVGSQLGARVSKGDLVKQQLIAQALRE